MTSEANVSRAGVLTAAPAFALPVLFLGYALVANYEFVNGLGKDLAAMPQSAAAYFNGEAAVQIDSYYKKIMPHRLPSIDLMGAARYLAFREGRPGVVVGDDGWLFSKEEFEAPLRRSADLSEAAKGLAEMRDALSAQGIELVVVPLAAKADVYRDHLADAAIPDDLEKLYGDFTRVLAEQGIRSVDSRSALIEAKAEAPVFLMTDTHWTPFGAQVVADAIGRDLGNRDPGLYRIADAAPAEREGDLSKFIVTGNLAPLVGLGPETIVPREAISTDAAPATDIFGGSAIPFVLTGTSYSANPQWSFGETLKVALGADVLNVAEEGLGPVAPLRKLIAGDTLREAPPEIVIWEFPIRYLGNQQLWDAPAEEATE